MTVVNRILAVGGLLIVIPVSWGLVQGRLTLADAGVRAAALLIGIFVLRRAVPWLVLRFADTLDGGARPEPGDTPRPEHA